MWTRAAFLLVVLAAASAEFAWKSGQQYTYKVTSKTITGLHTTPQYNGLVVKAELVLHANSDQELIAVIQNAQKAEIHTHLQKGHEFEIPKEILQFQPFTLTKQPFVIRMKEGIVDEVVISREVPIWEVNVIKSIVSQLQVDTRGQRIIPSKMNMVPEKDNDVTAVFKTMEDTVEGECEVLYDISPLPKYIIQRKPYLAPLYEMVKGENMINIVKTKNFTHCEHRPGFHYGITGMTKWEPTTNKMGDFLSRSSVARIIISGNLKTYTIHSSETTNVVTIRSELGSGEKSTVHSLVNLTLVSISPVQNKLQEPSHPQTIKNLVYHYNHPTVKDQEARQKWEKGNEVYRSNKYAEKRNRLGRSIKNEREYSDRYSDENDEDCEMFTSAESWHQEIPRITSVPQNPFLPYFVGCGGHSIQQCQNVNVNQVVKKLSEQIGTQLQEPNHIPQTSTLERFSMLVRVVRNMDAQQLHQATEELWTKEEGETQNPRRSYWMVFRDAVAQAGTGPALMTIKEWILTDKIHREEAAQVVASLAESTMHPTSEYMKSFFELVKEPKVKNQNYLNTTAIYSFTKLVRLAQVDRKSMHNRYPVHAFGRFTPADDRLVVEEYIPYFGSELQQAAQQQDSVKIQVYIRALGNMAHPKILTVFEPYLEGELPMTDFQRTLIIVSLNDLAKTYPKTARSVLYKTFSNIGEIHQVRVAAVYNLMRTVPPVNMLQRMAEASHDDPSIQVRSAIKSAIESAALLRKPINMKLRRNAQAAVNMLTPEVFGIHYSRKNITDFVIKDLNFGFTDTLSYIGSEDSILPSAVFYGLRSDIQTFQRKYFKIGAMVSSVQDLVDYLESTLSVTEGETQEPSSKDNEWSYEKITKMLNMEHDLMKQVEGNVLYKLAGAERYLTFDNHTIDKMVEKLLQYPYLLSMGYSPVYQKLYNSHDMQIGFPTATGLPFVYTLETPTLLYGRGKIQLKTDGTPKTTGERGHLAEYMKFGGTVNIQGVFTTRKQSKIGFVSPFDRKRYVAGIHEEHQVNIPVRMEVDVNLEDLEMKLDVQPYDKTGNLKIYQYNTQLYTSVVDITDFKPISEGSNYKRIEVHEPHKYQYILGERNGLGVRIEMETRKTHFDWKTLLMAIERHNMVSPFVFPIVGETFGNTKIDVYYDKTFARAVKLNLGVYGTLSTGKRGRKTTTTPNHSPMVKEVLDEIQRGIQSPETIVVNLEWEVKDQSKYSTILGYGYSPVSEEKRLVTRYQKKGGDKPYELCLDMVTKMPFVPETDFLMAVQHQPKGQVSAELRFGENGCKSGAHITLAGKFERTTERTEYLKKLPQTESCRKEMKNDNKLLSGCMNATYNANLLNRYIFSVKYDNVPVVAKNITYHVYSFLRHLGFPHLTEKFMGLENAQEKKIDMDMQFSPDLKSVSVYMTSPLGVAHFKDIRVNNFFRSVVVLHPTWNVVRRIQWPILRQQCGAVCTVDRTKVMTFDNVTYPVQLSKHWIPAFVSVPKIDREGQWIGVHKVAVLTKEISSNVRELMVVSNGKFNEFNAVVHVKSASGETPSVTINGKEVKVPKQPNSYDYVDEKGIRILKAYLLTTGEVKLVFPQCDFEVLYGVSRFQIKADQDYKNRVLGLCGDYNGERFDFITPKGKYLRDHEEFIASWALTTEGPYGNLKERVEKNGVRKTVILTGVVSDQDAGRADKHGRPYGRNYGSSEDSKEESECMTKRIMVIEREGKHCFSTNPQPSCKSGCQVERTTQMTTNFVCVNKTQTSSHWAQMVTRGAKPNLSEKMNNVQELTFQAPVECSKI